VNELCATCAAELEPIPDVGWLCLNQHQQPTAELGTTAAPPPAVDLDPEPTPGVGYGFTIGRLPSGEILLHAPGVPVSVVIDMLERSLVVARRSRVRIAYSQRMSKAAGLN